MGKPFLKAGMSKIMKSQTFYIAIKTLKNFLKLKKEMTITGKVQNSFLKQLVVQ
jgi:hypothetical protein